MVHKAGRCPRCRTGDLVYRTLELTGDVYTVCENYPRCSYVGDFQDGQTDSDRTHNQAG
ncbi:MAG: hypothetical protein M1415_07860 [Firmicutes bacterium]|nr:hypothetical protein [Bacillota bacterium]MCL5066383.1 hypothetical protein [Bacillota bacterium]